ncbi:MAG: hypothetical protein AAGF57_15525 [Pseudomonadota bacterium]
MSILQAPVLIANESNNALVGLGLPITITIVFMVIAALALLQLVSSETAKPAEAESSQCASHDDSDNICAHAAHP